MQLPSFRPQTEDAIARWMNTGYATENNEQNDGGT
jgi:hypothetical protein